MKRLSGFTLVELLVVMSIIGVLATIISTGFRSAQARGRDAERKSDLKQIAGALELYFTDYGKYPDTLPAWGTQFSDSKTVYMKSLPVDPVDSYNYLYRIVDNPTNQKFQLFAHLENTEDPDCLGGNCKTSPVNYLCGSQKCNFAVTSPNVDYNE